MRSEDIAATSDAFGDRQATTGNVTPRPNHRWLQFAPLKSFEWTRIVLPIERLPAVLQGLRIVHLSDIHLSTRWPPACDLLITRLHEDPPDLIAITGDLVHPLFDHRPALANLQRLLGQLKSRLGVYAITGNHDGDLLGPKLPALGVHLLNRRYLKLQSDQASLELIGLPGVSRRSFDPQFIESMPQRQTGVPRIVLGHFPDQIRHIQPLQADAMLTGHTHGGQICLPGRKALITHDALPRRMAHGVHRRGQTMLIVSRGLGFAGLPLRVFCPAEVIELRLGDANADQSAFPMVTCAG